jgi:hypothetical protein
MGQRSRSKLGGAYGGTKMLLGKSSPRIGQRVWTALIIFAASGGATLLCFFGTAAHAQASIDDQIAQQEFCNITGSCGQGQNPAARIGGVDPCYLAQNAMRPCTSDQRQVSKPVGVDPNLVGTWEIPFKGGPWVLNILRNGTYDFHSEAHDRAPSHAGTFSANNGHWSLKAKTGYTDAGDYLFQAPNIWIATGQRGAAAWLRPDLAQSAMRPCASAKLPMSNSATVDPNLVGIWNLPFKNGPWVWEISDDGTYKFHSEAGDGAPSHAGAFSATNGQWSLMATTGYNDHGLYLFQAPNIWMGTGQLGAAAWLHPSCN